ncbi:hypothetical protein PFICI_12080 [Pestalotiopsis fici W106-1]|uniref:Carbohydrate kinase PfkB domain-containing protein n=1 Tax=Pestalotiopsis fici (strain W106-1 / CGMCC3.15140) TaxID=1229662 RepID=W3WS72_PESFW|nr:uncharacterized protein PFICI_12080 [Pestalotiopsis fici W106-1]ETS76693.1 hypothetical protein PFICI_12080 [Pestalotiopsis fici W106-1]
MSWLQTVLGGPVITHTLSPSLQPRNQHHGTYSVPFFPSEDSKLRASSLTVRRGGNCPNSLEVLQQLLGRHPGHNVTPYLISALPSADSPAAAKIRESFGIDSIVDLTRCVYHPGHSEPASSYIIRSDATGSRTLVNYNDLPEVTVDDFKSVANDLLLGGGRTWWHFEGRLPETTLECITHLRKSSPEARISVEIEKPGRQGLQELAAEADVVFYSKSWAEDQGYQTARDCLEAQSKVARKATLLLCTWGSDGASCWSLPSGRCLSCAASPDGKEVQVVDAVGAGDTFIAGILFGLLCKADADADADVEARLRFAVQLATCKVKREGFSDLGRDVMGSK